MKKRTYYKKNIRIESSLQAPLAGILLGIMITYIQQRLSLCLCCGMLLMCISTSYMLFWNKKNSSRNLFLFSAFYIIGCLALYTQVRTTDHMRSTLNQNTYDLLIEVTEKEHVHQERMNLSVRVLRIKKQQEKTWNNLHNIAIKIAINHTKKVELGDILLLSNVYIKAPVAKQTTTETTPSYVDYLRRENSVCSLYLTQCNMLLIHRPKTALKKYIASQRSQHLQQATRPLWPQAAYFYKTVFLGGKSLTQNIAHLFSYWGISHFLARSGVHAMIFIMICVWLLRLLPLSIHIKWLCTILLLIFYTMHSWTSASFLRVILVVAVSLIGRICQQQTSGNYLLCLITILSLCWNPIQILFLDYQLSYGLALIIHWWLTNSYKEST